MTLDDIEKLLKEKLAYAPQIGATLKFDMGDDGVLLLDGHQAPPEITREDAEADTTLKCSVDTVEKLAGGNLDPTMAFMTGKLKISGSMGYAMKLASLLED